MKVDLLGGDPRSAIIERRLADVSRIIAVSSGKGGVGKSLIAATLALAASRDGLRVGLFDLDFAGSSAHLALGATGLYPEELHGIVPPDANGVKFMSVVHFVGEAPAPMRGTDVSNAITELLAITQWGQLDVLFVDMPPGLGDSTLDTIRLLPRAEFLVVTTSSKMAVPVVNRAVTYLESQGVPLIGVVVNMAPTSTDATSATGATSATSATSVDSLGRLPYDPTLEDAVGNPNQLLETPFGVAVAQLPDRIGLVAD
jgi:ATP-binding protein involved in chromosome partitioning